MFNTYLFALLLLHAKTESQFGTELAGVVARRTGFHQLTIAFDLHQLSTGTALAIYGISSPPGQCERLALQLRPPPRNQRLGPHHPFVDGIQFPFNVHMNVNCTAFSIPSLGLITCRNSLASWSPGVATRRGRHL